MGAYLSQPNTDKTSSDGGNNNVSYGFSAMQGWRVSMEVRCISNNHRAFAFSKRRHFLYLNVTVFPLESCCQLLLIISYGNLDLSQSLALIQKTKQTLF